MALLETKGLSKSFGGVQALQDVDVHIEEGSIHGLIGPNGSGKSTFFNVISGVYRPDSGSSVLFDNHEIGQLPPHKITELGISSTFQLLRLFLEMTVLENVMVGYHCHTPYGFLSPILQGSKVREADEKIQDEMIEMLQFLGLASYANLPAGELSGGQRRLLSLGRALAMKPKLLLLDEPGAGLSPVNVAHLMHTIISLKEKYKLTVMVVDHILKVVMNTCERITVLDHGQKIAEGSPEEVKNDHAVIDAYLGREMADEDIRQVIRA